MSHYKLKITYLLLMILLTTGCSSKADSSIYNNTIVDGLDSFAAEDYDKAEVYFELALNQNENDEWASSLLEQTINYKEALSLVEEEKYNEAIEKAEEVIASKEGSEAISKKAKEFSAEIEKKIDENLSFKDFMGYYLYFSEEDSSVGNILLTIENEETRNYYWASELVEFDILSKSIDGDILIVDYYYKSPYDYDDYEEYGTAEYRYVESNDEIMLLTNNKVYYKVSHDELEGYDFLIDDFMINDTD